MFVACLFVQMFASVALAAPATKVDVVNERYVAASSLNLRDAPNGTALRSLPINTRVVVEERVKGFAKVRVADGATGWVAERYLVAAPYTIDTLLWLANLAPESEERLTYAERAMALAPEDPGLMIFLAQAQRAAGEEQEAEATVARLGTTWTISLAGPWEPVRRGLYRLEASLAGYDISDPKVEVPPPSAFDEILEGLSVWVLPARGPAVRGPVRGVELMRDKPCAFHQYVLLAELDLARNDPPVAWTLAPEPPPTWSTPSVAKSFQDPVVTQRDLDGVPPLEIVEADACSMAVRAGDVELETRNRCCP